MNARKKAWVTFAFDESSAIEAIVLAKSLSRVVTVADTIVFALHEIPDGIRETLRRHFDCVIFQSIPTSANDSPKGRSLTKEDFLKISVWNLGMYSKCVALNSKTMILKNSDELFDLESDVSAVMNGPLNAFDFSIFALNPCAETYQNLSRLAISGQFANLHQMISHYKKSSKCTKGISPLDAIYHYNTDGNNKLSLDEAKIVTLEKSMIKFRENEVVENSNQKIVNDLWRSLYSELATEGEFNFPLSFSKTGQFSQKMSYYKDSIAIIGYSCRFPGSNNSNEFWELIKNGRDGICQMPSERLLDCQRDDPKFTETMAGFLKCPIDEFDAKFFEISPREASYMDPQQRLLAEVAWEALEDAAINPQSLKGSNTGVFSGVWTHDYERLITEGTSGQDFHHIVLGNAFSATSARVSYFLGLNGPNVATESGCSSSMVALHLASNSLRNGETNLGLVLGANVMIPNFALSEIPILARDGHCKTYDEEADGFARAEGVAVLILKRLPDAIADGDRVLALIRGSALSNEGTTSSFGTPSRLCQEIAIKTALKNSQVEPRDVDYVEAHGTGTPVGDPIEFAAISAGYAGKREKPLIVGSVKTNVGHTESAAGLAGVIKVILALKHEMIPPHINLKRVNPNINLNMLPAVIATELTPWVKNPNRKRIAGVSSFGISGTNVHALIEEPPSDLQYHPPDLNSLDRARTHFVLALSAKSENALKDLSENYLEFLKQNSNLDIGDVTFTANTGRANFKYRLSITGRNLADLISGLEMSKDQTPIQSRKLKIAFLFTGQGSQYFGMARALYSSNKIFQMAFEECNNVLKNNFKISLADAIWNKQYSSLLEKTAYSQLSIFSIEYCLLKLWESLGVKPEFVLGHSVGEFAAAVASGILNLDTALKLLILRSQLIENLPPGGMLAIHSSENIVTQLVSEFLEENGKSNGWLDIAVINSPQEIVVAGYNETLTAFHNFCETRKIKCQMLTASHAFHSRAMDAMLSDFATFSENISFASPSCGYISSTTGKLLSEDEMDISYWQKHVRQPVNFVSAIKTLAETGCNCFIEIGAHPVLLALSMTNLPNSSDAIWLPSLRKKEEDWQTLLSSLGALYTGGFNVQWKALDKSVSRKKVQLVHYPFQRQKYWLESKTEGLGKSLHPFLGRKMALAKVNDTVYENTWELKDFPYLKDHQVAHTTILPGAGFLEIILAAGKEMLANANTNTVLRIEDFVVECPLELEDDKVYKMQIVTSFAENDSSKSYVSIHKRQKLNGYNDEIGWKQYSNAVVKLCDKKVALQTSEKDVQEHYEEDIEKIKLRCPTENGAMEFYKRVPEIGIYFGETFQSIETVWEGTNEVLAKIPVPTKAGNIHEYIYHPVVLDAMIQTFGISLGKENADLYLPVGIDWFAAVNYCGQLKECKYLYAHAKWEQGKSQGTVSLYNDENLLLGVMKGLRLLRTSLGSFLNVINSQKNMLPGMYHEVWRVRDGPMQSRINLENLPSVGTVEEPLRKIMKQIVNPDLARIKIMFDEVICLDLILLFLENGWNPELGEHFDSEILLQNLLISPTHLSFFDHLLEILRTNGYFAHVEIENDSDNKKWKVVKTFPTINEAKERLDCLEGLILLANGNEKHPINEVMRKCKDHMTEVLQGKISAVTALFGTEGLDPLDVYTKSVEVRQANVCMGHYLEIALNQFKTSGATVRIIEIGGGSAATSKQIIQILQSAAIPFRYTFTDISAHFFETARQHFSNISGVQYKVLDIEKDPSVQGFCPNYYDIVVAANVLHATENLRTSIGNVRSLLKTNGLFLLQEMLSFVPSIDYIFGILDGFWKFKDFDLRKSHPMVSKPIWDQVFLENGFKKSICVSEDHEFTSVLVTEAISITIREIQIKSSAWIVFPDRGGAVDQHLIAKLSTSGKVIQIKNSSSFPINNDAITICLTDLAQVKSVLDKIYHDYDVLGVIGLFCGILSTDDYLPELLNICKYFAAKINKDTRVFIVTRGVQSINETGSINPNAAPIWGMVKSLANEVDIFGKLIDLDQDVIDPISESEEIFFELFEKEETITCYRNLKRYVSRYNILPKSTAPLVIPHGRYEIEIPKSKKIDDISFRSVGKRILGADEVEVLVKAVALNFRDVFVILKPDMFATSFDAVGTDFSGVVSRIGSDVSNCKVGDEVFGISNSSSAASHVIVNSHFLLPKPKSFTFCDASTIPSVFLTAYYCLVTVANLKKDEKILIHVASGGVGLIAIQIANFIGAKVIATAGSKRKRSYLRSIGVEHVFHSRDLSFEDEIMKITNKQGVNMVLNSLTSAGFKEASLNTCGIGARFVEMGKVNIWKEDEVQKLRSDVQYTIVDLEKLPEIEMKSLLETMTTLIKNEIFVPLPFSRFPMTNIKNAFHYFLKAQHIGKIVVAMPESKDAGGNYFHADLIFNSNATYLITGGLGGIGLEVAKWSVDCGARNIVLVSRTPPTEKVTQDLRKLRENGCNVLSLQVDVGNWDSCKELFQRIKSDCQLPPLRGVIHSAGALSDAIYANQTLEKFKIVFNAKINGGWNLHHLTKNMNLEHFVLFSSMAGIFGTIGQSNHAAANMFLDSLAHYRHSLGLPAQTINWGAWSGVGAATNTAYGKEGAMGVTPFTPNQGIAALKFIMTSPNLVQLGVIQLDIEEFKQHFGQRGNVLTELTNETENSTVQSSRAQSETFWNEMGSLTLEERCANIKTRIEDIIRRTLKLPQTETLDEYQTFSEMGLDSLMAVEMRNKVVNMIGTRVSLNTSSFLDFPTINSLSRHLAETTMTVQTESEPKPEPTDLKHEPHELVMPKADSEKV